MIFLSTMWKFCLKILMQCCAREDILKLIAGNASLQDSNDDSVRSSKLYHIKYSSCWEHIAHWNRPGLLIIGETSQWDWSRIERSYVSILDVWTQGSWLWCLGKAVHKEKGRKEVWCGDILDQLSWSPENWLRSQNRFVVLENLSVST